MTSTLYFGIMPLVINMEYNICRFLPNRKINESINIINLVFETECSKKAELRSIATYRLHYITEGKGVLNTKNRSYNIKAGDLVIIPPALFFSIENKDDIKYIYISFLGTRANALAEQFKFSNSANIFSDFFYIEKLWKSLFGSIAAITDIAAEGILLYTISEIGKRIFPKTNEKNISSVAERIKLIIDEDFCNSSLSVETIALSLSYHPKYISSVFKKEFGIGIKSYIKTLRLQHALTLMEQGMTSIKDISAICGFSDSLYFSNIFKKELKESPKEHIKNIAKKSQRANL